MPDLRVERLPGVAKVLVQRLGGGVPQSEPPFASWKPGGVDPRVLWRGPTERLVVSESQRPEELLERLARSAVDLPLVLTDVSHALELLRACGVDAPHALAADVGVSLTDRDFPVGHCARSSFAQTSVTIHRSGSDTWDIYVERPLVRAVQDWLVRNAGGSR